MLARPLVPCLLLLALLAPSVLAAETAPVLVERVDAKDLEADVGQPATARFTLFNLNPEDDFYVSVSAEAPDGWATSIEPNRFFLTPRNTTLLEIAFEATEVPHEEATFQVVFNLVDGRTGEVTRLTEDVLVASGAPPRVLGVFPNPLPAPLDNAYGTFVLDAAFYALFGLVALFLGDAIVRAVTARASNAVTREIITKLRRPIFYFVFLLGLSRSFAILPRNFVTEIVAKTLIGIAVGVFGLYVLYRVLDSALFYYQKEIAPRTNTTMDDVLVPVIRKVGIVALYVVGIVMTLRTLGWDPTIVFAGAGIAGLVIAFAAQDTFSNLFSGVFLMLDRPFKEGDDIRLESGDVARVEHIGLRTTRLYLGRAHESIILPNNHLASSRVVNLAGPDQRYWITIDIGASYDAQPETVKRALLDVALAHPKIIREGDWAPQAFLVRFGESSMDYQLRAGILNFRDRFPVASELRFAIKAAFDKEGIEIPYPHRTLLLKEAAPLVVKREERSLAVGAPGQERAADEARRER